MGFLNINSLPHLVEKLSDGDNIKITENSKGDRVGTVIKKIVEKADDVTKVIEQEVINNGYSFKVGTGNVDVSADVEDGFGEIGIKGVTYQNLISCDRNITVEGTKAWMNLQVHSSLVKPNTVYTLFFDVESISKGDDNYTPCIQAFSNNSKIINSSTNSFVFQTNSDTTFVTLRLLVNSAIESTTICKTIFKDIVLIEGNVLNELNLPSYFKDIVGVGDKSTNLFNKNKELTLSYDGHKIEILSSGKNIFDKSTITILLDEPLMRLPNGVCDEITRDGKLIRRVGKVVLNSSENWYSNRVWSSGDYQASYIKVTDKLMGKERFNFLCDRFAVTSQKLDSSSSIISECCFGEINNQVIYLTIKKEKLTSPDLTGFKQWLSENPTTVYYQLAEPIITELPVPYLRIFKDGHLTFNTLVAPESNHVVQLNKSAQIERSIREVQSLDSRVGKLERFYDDMMLETSHKLNLLTYDFEYAKERNNE